MDTGAGVGPDMGAGIVARPRDGNTGVAVGAGMNTKVRVGLGTRFQRIFSYLSDLATVGLHILSPTWFWAGTLKGGGGGVAGASYTQRGRRAGVKGV